MLLITPHAVRERLSVSILYLVLCLEKISLSHFVINHKLFLTTSSVNLISVFPPQHSILLGVNVQPRVVSKHLSDKVDSTWVVLKAFLLIHPFFIFSNCPGYSVSREFNNLMKQDIVFADCLTSFSFTDQIMTTVIETA